MRPIACHGARLAQCNPGVRVTPRRLFGSTPRRPDSSDARSPHDRQTARCHGHVVPDKSNDLAGTQLPENSESQGRTATVTGQQRTSQPSPIAVGTDADDGAANPRRTLRQRRLADVPKPPPVPAWFLSHNVLLASELAPKNDAAREGPRDEAHASIKCVDKETGHTIFTVPEHGSTFSAVYNTSSGAMAKGDQNSTDASDSFARDVPTSAWLDPMLWVILEAELSLQAALSLAGTQQLPTSFAVSRTDLSLICPDERSHQELDLLVKDLAAATGSDIVRLDVNDLEDLTAEYVGGNRDTPSSFATLGYDVFDGYVASRTGQERGVRKEEEDDELEEEEDEDIDAGSENAAAGFTDTLRRLGFLGNHLGPSFKGVMMIPANGMPAPSKRSDRANKTSDTSASASTPRSDFIEWDDARLKALLNRMLEAPREKRAATTNSKPAVFSNARDRRPDYSHEHAMSHLAPSSGADSSADTPERLYQRFQSRPSAVSALDTYRDLITAALFGRSENLGQYFPRDSVSVVSETSNSGTSDRPAQPRTIVHLRDLKDLRRTPLGDSIVRRLVRVVQRRRRSGEQIAIVGTSAQSGLGSWANEDTDDSYFRTMTVPPYFTFANKDLGHLMSHLPWDSTSSHPLDGRIFDINLRHIQSMLRRLQPSFTADLLNISSRAQLAHGGTRFLSERVLSLDEVQRLTLLALGLTKTYAASAVVQPVHLGLACFITSRADQITQTWVDDSMAVPSDMPKAAAKILSPSARPPPRTQATKVDKIRESCSQHETRLLGGVVDAANIKTGFDDVHVAPDTIEALKTLTELALLRPNAFKYGVLAKDRLPGLLLYGPPGTGKTLLAKAVAQGSQSTVLEVSAAQIFEKYVGEGEKMVRAVFSLARKLSPCVVFIDEADSIFGSRSDFHARNSHRAIINQFLREWDGMDDHGVFIMVATNRPFDLDDAVLRRLPRRLLVDLPVTADREKILEIHLQGEELDSSVSLARLAEQTPLYSGSDLKNMCVAAALACVREENALRASKRETDPAWELPDRRVLSVRHFDRALAEISASVSEDMATLSAIRKFDERYGDRKGRRPKTKYGFGAIDVGVDENAVRVRQTGLPHPAADLQRQPEARDVTGGGRASDGS